MMGQSVLSCAKTAETIEMPFGLWAWMGQVNHVQDWGADLLIGRVNFEGGRSAVSCAKTAEPMEMPFGLWTRVSPRMHVLDGAQVPMRRGNYY